MISPLPRQLKNSLTRFTHPVILTTLAVTTLILGVRQLGGLQTLELSAYDQLVRLRPDPGPDQRLLTVLITEEDIQRQGWPLSDQKLDRAFARLEQAQPRIIGLDLYRDLPVEPGNAQLSRRFQTSDRIIAVCKVQEGDRPAVAPPPTLPPEQVGFADIPIDLDGIVRRNLYYLDQPEGKCSTPISLSLQLALHYLAVQGIEPEATDQGLKLGQTVLKPLEKNSGGYRNLDARGYQILLNYRSGLNSTPTVTLTDLLTGKVDPQLIRDRAVLIGVSAPSLRDVFLTPFSQGEQENQPMPGVVVHAQMTSQLLSIALAQQSLIWVWPGWGENLWIIAWIGLAAGLVWRIRRPLLLIGVELALVGGVGLIGWLVFTQSGWLPLVPPALGILTASIGLVFYQSYRTQQEQQQVLQQVREQEQAIESLQLILQNTATPPPTPEPAVIDPLDTLLAGRYRVTKVLGRGGFGQTYLAEDRQRPGKPICVVKQLRPARQDPPFLKLARRLFDTEAGILEKLGRHKQIPQLLAYFEDNQNFYLVQEYIRGPALSQELVKPLSPVQVVSILKDVLEVLVFIHSFNVIHRDIKPDNILRRKLDNTLVLIDFGAVKQMRPPEQEGIQPEESKTVVIGTYGYAPAEQLAGQPVLNSDIYALGMIGIQALTAVQPLHLPRDPQTGELRWQDQTLVDERLANLLSKMVRYHFRDRYQSAAEVLKDLAQLGF